MCIYTKYNFNSDIILHYINILNNIPTKAIYITPLIFVIFKYNDILNKCIYHFKSNTSKTLYIIILN